MSRIQTRFAALAAEGRGALIPYLQACDPDFETSMALLRDMPKNGADLIEIGIPFSDPSADGPIIQKAAKRALKAGAKVARVLEMVRRFRQEDRDTPIILMGYLNPIDRYGPERFCREAAQAGVDGLIIVDLPPEEAGLILPFTRETGLDFVTLVAPNTPDERLSHILREATGMVYFVSITGITGTNAATEAALRTMMTRLRHVTDLPVAVGFGIRTPEQARTASRLGNGAVVASALIEEMAATLENGRATERTLSHTGSKLRELAEAVRR